MLGGLTLTDFRIQLLGHLAHLALVTRHRAVNEEVAEEDDRQWGGETAQVQAQDERSAGKQRFINEDVVSSALIEVAYIMIDGVRVKA